MKLEDMELATKLKRDLGNCDFMLGSLAMGPSTVTIRTHRGGLVESYGRRDEFVSEAFMEEVHAGLVREVMSKRREHIAALAAIGIEVAA